MYMCVGLKALRPFYVWHVPGTVDTLTVDTLTRLLNPDACFPKVSCELSRGGECYIGCSERKSQCVCRCVCVCLCVCVCVFVCARA